MVKGQHELRKALHTAIPTRRRVLMIMEGHRQFRADVPSCSSVPFLNSAGYLDGKLIERAGRGMQPGFGNTQVLRRSLEIAMAEQELNPARIDAGIEWGGWQTSGAAR